MNYTVFLKDHCIKLHKLALLAFAIIIAMMTVAVANVDVNVEKVVVLNQSGFSAPFLRSWTPIWVFAMAGGIGSMFFKIDDIDKNFRYLLIAKPFLGLFGALTLCLIVTDGNEPPKVALTSYAFLSALLSAPILQALLAVASLKENQAELFNKINPFKFKVVVDDKKGKTDD